MDVHRGSDLRRGTKIEVFGCLHCEKEPQANPRTKLTEK